MLLRIIHGASHTITILRTNLHTKILLRLFYRSQYFHVKQMANIVECQRCNFIYLDSHAVQTTKESASTEQLHKTHADDIYTDSRCHIPHAKCHMCAQKRPFMPTDALPTCDILPVPPAHTKMPECPRFMLSLSCPKCVPRCVPKCPTMLRKKKKICPKKMTLRPIMCSSHVSHITL